MSEATMADVATQTLDDADDDNFMASLDKKAALVQEKAAQKSLHDDIANLYASGQIPSIRDGLHISDVIGRHLCSRKAVLLHCYKQNPVIHGQRQSAIFDNGSFFHKRWQENIDRSGKSLAIEMPHIETFWQLLFTPDQIVDFRGRPTIFEYKGYNSREFSLLRQKKKLPHDAIVQANLYMWFTGIHFANVIVECKDTQEFLVWELVYDPALALPYEPEFNKIAALVKIHQATGKLPKRLGSCTSPDDDIPKGCGGCMACFTKPDERIQLRRKAAWE